MSMSWSSQETNELILAYFDMLLLEQGGEKYSKTEHNKRVREATGRSKGSIEFKFCNISHVLADESLTYINGYKPRSHVQKSLKTAVLNYISSEKPSDSNLEPAATDSINSNPTALTSNLSSPLQPETMCGDMVFVPEEFDLTSLWSYMENLWDRSTGGTDVAARPDTPVNEVWPSGIRPPGVAEGIEWLRRETTEDALPKFLFLIGGPGAGKSHATAQAVDGMKLTSDLAEGLAHRTYTFQRGKLEITVLNDATISSDGETSPLASDINDALAFSPLRHEQQSNLIACVNRGIIVEELSELRKSGRKGQPAGLVIRWLGEDETSSINSEWKLSAATRNDYIKSSTLSKNGMPKAVIIAVYVDECSLFEPRPAVEIQDDSSIISEQYNVTRFTDRVRLPVSSTPASDLLEKVLGTIKDRTIKLDVKNVVEADPIAANMQTLESPEIRSSVLTLARSAEFASSVRMTYREVWGLFSRALVGDATVQMSRQDLGKFIMENQPQGISSYEDFTRLRRLSNLRLNQSLFGAGFSIAAGDEAKRDPVLKIMTNVDPIRDSLPGNMPFDPNLGWATPISEAFSYHYSESTPLSSLLTGGQHPQFDLAVTPFDHCVDNAYAKIMVDKSLTDKQRLESAAWYGSYLTRLYAVAYGIPAFRREISTLVETIAQSPHIPDHLISPLQTLIRPKRNPVESANESLLPLFDSRTDPITERLAEPKLAIGVGALELRTHRTIGEQTLLTIHREGQLMGKMTLDFALIREAIACAADRTGVTDLVDLTAPRLERIRASRLLPARLIGAELRIADSYGGHQVTQSKSLARR